MTAEASLTFVLVIADAVQVCDMELTVWKTLSCDPHEDVVKKKRKALLGGGGGGGINRFRKVVIRTRRRVAQGKTQMRWSGRGLE